MARLTPAQRNHLQRRIGELYGWGARADAIKSAKRPDTPVVAKARALVKRFDKVNERIEEKIETHYRAEYDKHRAAVLFMEPVAALAYVENLKPVKTRKAVRRG